MNPDAVLRVLPFPGEEIIGIHRIPYNGENKPPRSPVTKSKSSSAANPSNTKFPQPQIRTENYFQRYAKELKGVKEKQASNDILFGMNDGHVLEHSFPTVELDTCVVVTSRSAVSIELTHEPHIVFLELVRNGEWSKCEQFCKVFGLEYNCCVEFAGDALLRRSYALEALHAYKVAQVYPIKTALKLAMFGQNVFLMNLCAMTLKIAHVIESGHPKSHVINYVMQSTQHRNPDVLDTNMSKTERNCGKSTSNFSYDDHYEPPSDLQMSSSSQFHLANLLLLTLTERAIKENRPMPLWNFLVINKRYHTNMSSIVLAQSGLYSSSTVLALSRGAQLDVFCALVSVVNQQFGNLNHLFLNEQIVTGCTIVTHSFHFICLGWYSEYNNILYQLSDPMFMECIIYLQSTATDYLNSIKAKATQLTEPILERLRHQLDPFTAIFRPLVSQLSSNFVESDTNDMSKVYYTPNISWNK